MKLRIRDFHYQDLPAVIHLTQESFAEYFQMRGQTPESVASLLKSITRGHMVPFRILSALSGYKWAILVAEMNDEIVGMVVYFGTAKQATLDMFMVAPTYRGHGIGKALLKAGMDRLKRQNCPVAIASVLEHNNASRSSFIGQGFEVYAYSVSFDLPVAQLYQVPSLMGHPPRCADRHILQRLERQVVGDKVIELSGSEIENLYPHPVTHLWRLLDNMPTWARVFESKERIAAFARAYAARSVAKGNVPALVVDRSDPSLHLSILRQAAKWCASINPTISTIRVTLRSETRPVLPPAIVQHASEMVTFLEFVKRLS